MPIGPLAVLDEVNLELTRKVRVQTEKDLAAEGKPLPMDAAVPVIDKMLNEFKRPGKKEGARFLRLSRRRQEVHLAGFYDAFVKPERLTPVGSRVLRKCRSVFCIVNRSNRLAAMKKACCAMWPDANIGSIFGIGFAPWTGGVLQYINFIGLPEFVKRANELVAKHGERFTPPKLLVDMAAKGETFV
jgi:3-hydroxyacyl-CoA dehydrogenase/enoyl-CoA hydratase/3-hydroxybutyryl-CoA epimerase